MLHPLLAVLAVLSAADDAPADPLARWGLATGVVVLSVLSLVANVLAWLALYRARGAVIETMERPEHQARLDRQRLDTLRRNGPDLKAILDPLYAEERRAHAEMHAAFPRIARDLRAVRRLTRSFGGLLSEVTRAVDANTAVSERLVATCHELDERDRQRADAHAQLLGAFQQFTTQPPPHGHARAGDLGDVRPHTRAEDPR